MNMGEIGNGEKGKSRDRSSHPMTVPGMIAKAKGSVLALGIRLRDAWFPPDAAKRAEAIGRLQTLGLTAARGLFAFLLSRASLQGAFPLGIAYLCAATVHVPVLFAGAMLGCFFAGERWLLCGCLTLSVFAVRYFVSRFLAEREIWTAEPQTQGSDGTAAGEPTLLAQLSGLLAPPGVFAEGVFFRAGTAALGGALGGVMLLMEGSSHDLPLLPALLFLLAAPLFCFGFSARFAPTPAPAVQDCGALTVAAGVVLSLSGTLVFGLSLRTASALFLTLYASRTAGLLRGMATGLAVGLCCDPLYTPAFAAAGLLSGVLWRCGSGALAVVAALFGAGGYAIYVGGFAALRAVVPDFIVASALFYPLTRLRRLPGLLFGNDTRGEPVGGAQETEKVSADAAALRRQDTVLRAKMESLGQALRELGEAFAALSDQARKPAGAELRALCSRVCTRYCKRCAQETRCWGDDYDQTCGALDLLSRGLAAGGRAGEVPMPAAIRHRCRSLEAILTDCQQAAGDLFERKAKGEKTEGFAASYQSISKLLMASLAEHAAEYTPDPVLSARVQRAMEYRHFHCQTLTVFSGRRREVAAEGVSLRCGIGAGQICRAFGALTGVQYGEPTFTVDGRHVHMLLEACPTCRATAGTAQLPARPGDACGDALSVFENQSSCFYAVLCDGMGSGREAALTAQICTLFLEKMLLAGNSHGISLEMLNAFLRARGGECSATTDLLEIDLIRGTAAFIKSGAAPSFVVRAGHVFRIASNTAPMGILRQIHAQKTTFDLQSGDIVVLISDGVCETEQEQLQLLATLETGVGDDLQAEAARLLRLAAQHRARCDDSSVLLIRIEGEVREPLQRT